eukprot:4596076-Alexandrium_andersonii.AAC.1
MLRKLPSPTTVPLGRSTTCARTSMPAQPCRSASSLKAKRMPSRLKVWSQMSRPATTKVAASKAL